MYIISINIRKKNEETKWLFAGKDFMTGYPAWIHDGANCSDIKTFSDIASASLWFDKVSSFLKNDLENYKIDGYIVNQYSLAIRKIVYEPEKIISFKKEEDI